LLFIFLLGIFYLKEYRRFIMGIDPITLGVVTMLGLGAWGASEISASGQRKEAKSAREAAERQAGNRNLGNLTDEEAGASASKRAFRKGIYFTSPTGLSGSGTRGRSRLMGA
jgi:hypothetical protein